MKTRQELQKIVYAEQLNELRLPDLVVHLHIITGADGKCMCGFYSGKKMTCTEILASRSENVKQALSKEGIHYA
jgi:hypothetical protein